MSYFISLCLKFFLRVCDFVITFRVARAHARAASKFSIVFFYKLLNKHELNYESHIIISIVLSSVRTQTNPRETEILDP